jgi:hypothetical protein
MPQFELALKLLLRKEEKRWRELTDQMKTPETSREDHHIKVVCTT